MSVLEIILSIVTAASTLGNITQWVNLRALKDKSRYEADAAYIENLVTVNNELTKEITRLQERVKQLESRITQLEQHGREEGQQGHKC